MDEMKEAGEKKLYGRIRELALLLFNAY